MKIEPLSSYFSYFQISVGGVSQLKVLAGCNRQAFRQGRPGQQDAPEMLLRSIGFNAVDGVLEANGSCTVNMHRTPGGGVQRRGVEKAVGSAGGFWT